MGELTFFLGLQVTQKDDGIFISQDKYVDEILKKFGFSTMRITSTPMETSKPLLKDAKAEDVDDSTFDLEAYSDSDYAGVSLDRKSTTGGCQFLGSRLISWQCKKQTIVAISTTEVECVAAANCCGTVTPLFATMLIQSQAVEGEGSGQPTQPQHTPTTASLSHVEQIPIAASSSQPKKTQKHRKTKRKATKISQSSRPTTLIADETVHKERGDSVEGLPLPLGTGSGRGPRRQDTILGDRPAQTWFERLSKQSNEPPLSRVNTLGSGEDNMKLQELMDLCTTLSDRVLDLENVKDAQALEIKKLKKRVKKLESKKSRTPQIKRRLFKMKSAKSKAKGVTMQEPSESGTRVRVPPPQIDPKDKGKAKMVEPEKPKKKKDQIEYDADVA
ncbi:hypothetical protein Tco_1272150 [Tanacetum coccineum]